MIEDPGWWPAIKAVPRKFILLSANEQPRLIGLRASYLSFVAGLALILPLLALVDLDAKGGEPWPVGPTIWGLVGYWLITAGLGLFLRRFALRGSGEPAELYSHRMFLDVAFGSSVALVGFVMAFVTESLVLYPVGLALSAPMMALAAPTRTSVSRAQEQNNRLGRQVDLASELMKVPPRPPRPRPFWRKKDEDTE